MAVRTCYDFWRKRYRSREVPESGLSDSSRKWLERVSAEQSSALFDADANRKEAREVLTWALSQLPPKDRMVLELVYLEGYTIKEAAGLTGAAGTGWCFNTTDFQIYASYFDEDPNSATGLEVTPGTP